MEMAEIIFFFFPLVTTDDNSTTPEIFQVTAHVLWYSFPFICVLFLWTQWEEKQPKENKKIHGISEPWPV